MSKARPCKRNPTTSLVDARKADGHSSDQDRPSKLSDGALSLAAITVARGRGDRAGSSWHLPRHRPELANGLLRMYRYQLEDTMLPAWQLRVGAKNPDSVGTRFIDIPMRGDIIALSFLVEIAQQRPLPSLQICTSIAYLTLGTSVHLIRAKFKHLSMKKGCSISGF